MWILNGFGRGNKHSMIEPLNEMERDVEIWSACFYKIKITSRVFRFEFDGISLEIGEYNNFPSNTGYFLFCLER